jgi:hypothetical protein
MLAKQKPLLIEKTDFAGKSLAGSIITDQKPARDSTKRNGTPFHILLRNNLIVATNKITRRKKVTTDVTMATFNPFFL